MKTYKDIIQNVLDNGTKKPNRTGIDTISVTGTQFRHDMRTGFPLATVKKTPFKLICVELEGFIKGITDKKWYEDNGCNIWSEWANPSITPYGHDEESKRVMKETRDLGPIYGYQLRNFNKPYTPIPQIISLPKPQDINNMKYDAVFHRAETKKKYSDQLQNIVDTLKSNPTCRRMVASYWNLEQFDEMSLLPCHYNWQVVSDGKNIDLVFNMRSVDVGLGMTFDIVHYGMMFKLLALEVGMTPRWLVGNFADTHIYENHIEGLIEMMKREPLPLPEVEIPDFTSIFNWSYKQRKLINYKSHDKIALEVAV